MRIRPMLMRLTNLACLLLVLAMFTGVSPRAAQAEEPAAAPPAAAPTEAEQAEFFEAKVRPLLVERCQECHGADTQEAGLRLDSRSAIMRGAESGAVVVPGDPAASPLVAAIDYRGEIQMPPAAKLADAEIEILKTWVKLGAPWPGSDAVSTGDATPSADANHPLAGRIAAAKTSHWSLQPIVQPAIPPVQNEDWASSPIDRFILARLEGAGLAPSPAADRRTLLRRVKFDLVGLPPTVAEIEDFVHDESPDAWARVVDRLLASPEYGQRWARHWLDVARYADTRGYAFTSEPRFPFSYTYRDYVVRSFNEDLPFNQFVREQLAADQLPLGDDKRSLAALGFLTLGRTFDNNIHDIIDDRIDVVTRGFLGLTVTCARCHDHKYDPIPTADYYSLYGVFASSEEPGELPVIAMPDEMAMHQAYQDELAAKQAEYDKFLAEQRQAMTDELRSNVGAYLLEVVTTPREEVVEKDANISLSPGEVRPQIRERWRTWIAEKTNVDHPVFGAWHRLAALPAGDFATSAQSLVAEIGRSESEIGRNVNPVVREAFARGSVMTMMDVAKRYGEILSGVHQQWKELHAEQVAQAAAENSGGTAEQPPAPTALPDAAANEVLQVLVAEGTPTIFSQEDLPWLLERTVFAAHSKLRGELDTLAGKSPEALARAMVLVDAKQPMTPRIFQRGNPGRPGPEVPRRFLEVLSSGEPTPFQQGSGRLELAQAIVDPANPLTARVIVNRVWAHHFGVGLVTTPSDFGTRSDPPSHPELLDFLAATFRDEGWSLKRLHRAILLSNAYQQASADRPEAATVDPENRLVWRMNRRRLEFEPLRDSLLAVAGRLDTTLAGRPIDLFATPFSTRRSVYGFLDRQSVPGVLRVFDFANPDASSEARPNTTVPQQALYLMNAPFVIEQAQHVAALPEIASAADPASRAQALYRQILARGAEPDELELALQYVSHAESHPQADTQLNPWQRLAQVLLLTNEFTFVD
ncbi:MAG: PSD1 domain-containing protein [Pirellulales bacterium]|nr:PSD1 domain-containing protein [Pirellulales bacterium]